MDCLVQTIQNQFSVESIKKQVFLCKIISYMRGPNYLNLFMELRLLSDLNKI